MKAFPFYLICKRYYKKQVRSTKAGITVGKVHGYDKPLLPCMKPENCKILSLIPSGTTINQPQLVPNIMSEEDWKE